MEALLTNPQVPDKSALDFTAHEVTFIKDGKRQTGRCFGCVVLELLQVTLPDGKVALIPPQNVKVVR